MRYYVIIIPLIAFSVASLGGFLTSTGLGEWYDGLNKPSFTPQGSFIGMVWTTIYALTAISAIIVWSLYKPWGANQRDTRFQRIITAFFINAFLNVFWSFLFFNRHLLLAAFFDAIALGLSALAIAILTWKVSKTASILIWPYVIWVSFASYLNFTVWKMNL